MDDFDVSPVIDTRIARCLPIPKGVASMEMFALTAQYYDMFYGGVKEFKIPSVSKLSRMSPRRRKKIHCDGKNTTLGYDLTIEFSREVTKEDAPVDAFNFSRDSQCPFSEHQKNAANWFLNEIESHNLFTVMGVPFSDPMKETFLVSADHDKEEPFFSQMERLLKFLYIVDVCPFVGSWVAQWYSLDHWNEITENAFEFAKLQKGDIFGAPIPFDSMFVAKV